MRVPGRVAAGALRVLGSFGLASSLLVLLTVLTLLGTLAQQDRTLYDVQEDYFASAFVWIRLPGGIPFVLPGAYLLLGLLFLNLLVGGFWRLRKRRATVGVLTIHIGFALLLIGSFVEDRWAAKGELILRKGESASFFYSDRNWEVCITEWLPEGGAREHVIGQAHLARAVGGHAVRAGSEALPFDVLLEAYVANAEPRLLRAGETAAGAVDGVLLEAVPPQPESPIATPGLTVTLVEKQSGARHRGLLWALEHYPYHVRVADRRWVVDLRRRRWTLPFTLRLERFVHEAYPGTRIARRFSSYVEKIEDGVGQTAHITMNEPLRHEGYTFYQHDWGPKDGSPDVPTWSAFAVVRNPSDRIPVIACIVIAAGLLIHWIRKLVLYLRWSTRRRAAADVPSVGVSS